MGSAFVKRAAFADNWRHVMHREHPLRVLALRATGLVGIGNLETEVGSGNVLAICGGNGSGKTTILRCIHACLGGLVEDPPTGYSSPDASRMAGGEIELKFLHEGVELTQKHILGREEAPFTSAPLGDVYYFEPSASSPALMKLLNTTPNLEEEIEANGYREMSPDIYAYAVGRSYSSVRVAEIELGGGTAPYFEVECGSGRYASQDMGLGEFAMFHLIWLLEYVPQGSLVLIEEPEAFISPRSQFAVADIVAKYTDEKRLFTIFTTHSPQILSRVPVEAMRILVRGNDGCELVPANGRDQYMAVLGLAQPPAGIVFVEDLAAEHMTEAALREHAPGLLARVSVVRLKGDTSVLSALGGLPTSGHPIQFAGLLDGDQRDKGHASDWPLLYLPGAGHPDQHMLDAVSADVESFAHFLGMDAATVKMHASSLEGADPHDWPHEFSHLSGANLGSVFEAMGSTWARAAQWVDEARSLCGELNGIYDA